MILTSLKRYSECRIHYVTFVSQDTFLVKVAVFFSTSEKGAVIQVKEIQHVSVVF